MRARAWDSACTLHQCGCDRLPRNGTWSFAYINRSQSYFETIEAFDKSRAKFATCNVRNVCIRKMKRKKGAEERPGVLFSVFTIDEVCVCTDVHASGEVSHYLRVNDSTSWWTILQEQMNESMNDSTSWWTILREQMNESTNNSALADERRVNKSAWANEWTSVPTGVGNEQMQSMSSCASPYTREPKIAKIIIIMWVQTRTTKLAIIKVWLHR